jgi:hypothetical protein
MKNTRVPRKLHLPRETIRALQSADLSNVEGASVMPTLGVCSGSNNSCGTGTCKAF